MLWSCGSIVRLSQTRRQAPPQYAAFPIPSSPTSDDNSATACNVQRNPAGSRDAGRPKGDCVPAAWLQVSPQRPSSPPNYVGFRRHVVALHMQFPFEHELGTIRLRLMAKDPGALLNKCRQHGVVCTPNSARDTPSGTREFASMICIATHLPFAGTAGVKLQQQKGKPVSQRRIDAFHESFVGTLHKLLVIYDRRGDPAPHAFFQRAESP